MCGSVWEDTESQKPVKYNTLAPPKTQKYAGREGGLGAAEYSLNMGLSIGTALASRAAGGRARARPKAASPCGGGELMRRPLRAAPVYLAGPLRTRPPYFPSH